VFSVAMSSASRPRPPGRSPAPSAYGVSPTTAIAAWYVPSMPVPLRLYVTVVDVDTAERMPCSTVVPGVTAPLPPCQEIVQPPLW
jgi:hypothetical protein